MKAGIITSISLALEPGINWGGGDGTVRTCWTFRRGGNGYKIVNHDVAA